MNIRDGNKVADGKTACRKEAKICFILLLSGFMAREIVGREMWHPQKKRNAHKNYLS